MGRFNEKVLQRYETPLIGVQDLQKSYPGSSSVLDGVSLNIGSGERIALIGSNGAGKSTLLKCLVGIHPNSGGSITIFNETFSKQPDNRQFRKIRNNIGFVFQSHGLVKRLSSLSNVIHGFLGQPGSWRASTQLTAKNEWRQQAYEALALVNLTHKAMERVDQLSGGQAQRVAIARALVRQPKLMIADEPAASLDPVAGHEVMQQFANLASEKKITLVFTSHDMEHALKYSDRIVALKTGKIVINSATNCLSETDLSKVFRDQSAH